MVLPGTMRRLPEGGARGGARPFPGGAATGFVPGAITGHVGRWGNRHFSLYGRLFWEGPS